MKIVYHILSENWDNEKEKDKEWNWKKWILNWLVNKYFLESDYHDKYLFIYISLLFY